MLHLLAAFCAVADAGSLNRAAEALHMTQPAVTRQIQALERELGAVLLARSRQGVQLTPAGLAILQHARRAVSEVQICRELARENGAGASGRLRLAVGLMVTQFILPPALAQLRREEPGLEVELNPGHYGDAAQRLLAYEADAALVATEIIRPELTSISLFPDPLMLVTSPGTAQPETARMADLAGKTLLVLPPAAGMRQEVERALERSGVDAHLREYPSTETAKTAIALGMGISVLPASAVRAEVAAGSLSARPMADWPYPARQIRLVTRAEGRIPDGVRRLVAILKEIHGEVQG